MSKAIDTKRRSIIKGGVVTLVTLLIQPQVVLADELTDLINQDNKNQIIAVRLWPSSVYTRLTLESENYLDATYTINGNNIYLTIKNATLNAILQKLSSKILSEDPIVKNIKVNNDNTNDILVTIGLKQNTLVQTKHIPPINLDEVNYKYRYVIDMYPNSTTDDQLNDDLLAVLQLNPKNNERPSDDAIAKLAIGRDLPYPELKQAHVVSDKKKGKVLILLDPGHGGEDPGAIGATGTKEKHVVLDIAKRLYALINQTDYMTAKLTRNDDIFIPLGTRVAIARRARADMFLSIHADAFITPNAKGSSVFILSERGATSTFARWLAKTQNNADLIGGMSFKTKDVSLNKVLLDMTQSWSLGKSDKLAKTLLTSLANLAKLHNGHVEKAAFAVLKAPDIPSVLIETAFISNPYEESKLKTGDFRQKMAETIFNGVSEFAKNILYS